MVMRRFEGKRVLVTGGSSGIGRATVLAFAAEGARVVACARREDRLVEVLAAAPTGSVLVLTGNMGSAQDSRRTVNEAIELASGLDILVNNAGVSYMEPFLDATEGCWN
jgi:NAD(P)-dependent dehydrogenase (short-subunit alcohol dehydrogenase family)